MVQEISLSIFVWHKYFAPERVKGFTELATSVLVTTILIFGFRCIVLVVDVDVGYPSSTTEHTKSKKDTHS